MELAGEPELKGCTKRKLCPATLIELRRLTDCGCGITKENCKILYDKKKKNVYYPVIEVWLLKNQNSVV